MWNWLAISEWKFVSNKSSVSEMSSPYFYSEFPQLPDFFYCNVLWVFALTVSLPLKQIHAIRETQNSSIKSRSDCGPKPPAAPEDLCVSQWTKTCYKNVFLMFHYVMKTLILKAQYLFFKCLKMFFLGYKTTLRGMLHFVILQTLWECYFWMLSKALFRVSVQIWLLCIYPIGIRSYLASVNSKKSHVTLRTLISGLWGWARRTAFHSVLI